MKLKVGETTEVLLIDYKGGDYVVELSEAEIQEYRIIEKMFFDWQNRLKIEAKDKYDRHIFQKVD